MIVLLHIAAGLALLGVIAAVVHVMLPIHQTPMWLTDLVIGSALVSAALTVAYGAFWIWIHLC